MKNFFLLATLLIYTISFSQYSISGFVNDNQNKKMSNVIIQLKETKNDEVITYTNTNENGYYELFIDKTGSYLLECNSWEFVTKNQEIIIDETKKKVIINFDLKPKLNQLEEVIVLANSSMKEKGDTLSYNLKSFTTGSERNLKDILNKLPGIEIDENGHIKANGKPIDKLLVDGQEFFGDNHQIATENLNSEMIGGVDIYNHYTNNSNIKDIEGSEKTALNIAIKKGYKGKITGNISAYSGYENRYKLASNLFRFDKEINLSFIENTNNTNEESISLMDYFNMNKSIKNELTNNTTSNFSANEDIPSSLLTNDNVSTKKTNFAALNFSYFPSSKFKIEGFNIFNKNFQIEKNINSNKFIQGINSFQSSDDVNSKSNFIFNQTKCNAELKLNEKKVFNYSFSIEPNKENQEKKINQTFPDILNTLSENQNNSKLKFGHQISFINRLAKNKLLTFNTFQEITTNANNYDLSSNLSKFELGNNFIQNKSNKLNEFGILGKFAVKLNQTIFLIGAGYTSVSESFSSILGTSNSQFENINNNKRNNFYFENSISKRKGFLQYLFENRVSKFINNFNNAEKIYFLPKIQLKLEIKSTSNITFNYQRQLQFANANQVFEKPIIQNYYLLNQENKLNLNSPILINNYGLSYFLIDLFSGTILYANINYAQSKNSITTNSSFKQNYSIINNQYSKFNENLNANLSFERKIKFVKTRLKSNISYSKMNGINFLNNFENNYQNEIYFARFSLNSKFKKSIFNYSVGYETQFFETKYQNNDLKLSSKIQKPFINFEGNLSKTTSYHFNNSYSIYKSQNTTRNFFKTDFELTVKKVKSNWEFYFKANDILNLNTTQVIETNLENNIEQTRILSRLPGYIGIGTKYNL
jgi:hypothetical protein